MKKLLITLIVLILVAAGAAVAYYYTRRPVEPDVLTGTISRGEVLQTVSATGTLEAVQTVQVGTQVTGVIKELHADFNTIVHKGQLLARLDPTNLQAALDQQKASLVSRQTDLERQRVSLEDARTKLKRSTELAARNLVTQQDLETAQLNVKTLEAQVKSSEAAVQQQTASVNQAQINLDYTDIYSPLDGTVIDRKVDVGQTVVSNQNASVIFSIAADLTKMQARASVDESDVALIRTGQHVTFRVDAYQNQEFTGTVSQVRLQPVVSQNVVTYTTIVEIPNPDYKLKPGMTTNVKIEIARRENVLRIPNGALRFRPTQEIFTALNQEMPPELQRGRGGFGTGRDTASGAAQAASGTGQGRNASKSGGQIAGGPGMAPGGQGRQARGDQAQNQGPGQAGRAGAGQGRGQGAERAAMGMPEGGRGGQAGERGQGGFQMDPERTKRFQERMANMTPEEREQFQARMRDRQAQGGQGGGFGRADSQGRADRQGQGQRQGPPAPEPGDPTSPTALPHGETIDALFGPLQFTETRGRAWLLGSDKKLKSVALRLGITDGNLTEIIGQPEGLGVDSVVVTAINLPTSASSASQAGRSPLMPGGPGRGGPGGGGFRGGGPGR